MRTVWTPLAVKQATRGVIAACAIGLLMSFFEIGLATMRERAKVADLVDQILDLAEGSAALAAWNLDPQLSREVSRSVLAISSVEAVEITLTDGQQLWAASRPSPAAERSPLTEAVFGDLVVGMRELRQPVSSPAKGTPQVTGQLTIRLIPEVVAADFLAFSAAILMGGLLRNVLLGLALAWVFHRFLTRPLIDLGRAIATVNPQKPMQSPVRMPAGHHNDELGYVVSRFNEMLAKLHFSQLELRRLATRDTLTDLPNRGLVTERLSHALVRAKRNGNRVAVLFMDLDRFKHINDSLGHSTGDLLLRGVADRLRATVRAEDTVGRLGGDEFLVIAEHVPDATEAMRVAERLQQALARAFTLEGNQVHAGCSIGIALYPEDGADPETLLRHADVAMYAAKGSGSGTFRFFSQEMTDRAVRRLRTEASLREAVEHREFELFYQPKVDARTGRVRGVEALLRWRLGDRYVPPMDFIGLAEETGLIVPIGEWVLREACRTAAAWGRRFGPLTMAVNVSARQLSDPFFPVRVAEILEETSLAPERLILELTETALMRDMEANARVLDTLRGTGVGIAIDDFGTGYSSLAYLRQLPVTILKVDRSFVSEIPEDTAIAATVIALADKLGLLTVAEGVETEEQRRWLAEEGCAMIQGFLISRPLPRPEIEAVIAASQAGTPAPTPGPEPEPALSR
ncbi:MAG TPA: EAL domain-containing protein [Azospirillaceae bacterium]|nr:EAL domain-containing protein [Azospirillaceae bacterium]